MANQLIDPLDGAPLREPGRVSLALMPPVTMLFHAASYSYQIIMHGTLIQDDRR